MVNIGVEVSVELFRPILFFDSGSGRLYTDELVIICMYIWEAKLKNDNNRGPF